MASPRRTIRLAREGFPEPPELDTAVSRAILDTVASGTRPETLRVHRPGPIVAFGPKDRLAPGYADAIHAARERGFATVQRLAGGRAAVFHQETIAVSWAIPDRASREGVRRRFEEIATIVVEALRAIGIDARMGEVPGEYCPGEHSVNARGVTKLMGVGQRLVTGAAHVGAVLVVGGSDRVREVLIPGYAALGLAWDPATVGSLRDENPGITWDDAEAAILDRFAARFALQPATLDEAMVAAARSLAPAYRTPRR